MTMKLCVVVPTEEYLAQAGVRIRYERIRTPLQTHDCEIDIVVIDALLGRKDFSHDIYLFSKCYDARVFLMAALVRKYGKLCGIDFFDDYFSQSRECKFIRHREWLRSAVGLMDFHLCSTERMAKVIGEFATVFQCHVLNDPYESFDMDAISEALAGKVDETLATGIVHLAWFGVGDNPHFAVGLHDLLAYSCLLNDLRSADLQVELHILTNKRALNARGLEMIERLPVLHTLEEWTTDKEAALLKKCLAAFIPVNGQNFSIAKSMNRAVTALTAGVQVISAGYPLYRKLDDFIYRDPAQLLQDLRHKELRLRPQTLGELDQLFADFADTDKEALKLARFLHALPQKNGSGRSLPESKSPTIGIVHGVKSPTDFHKQIQKLGQLSISSPFGTEKLNYDIRFVADGTHILLELEKRLLPLLAPALKESLREGVSGTGRAIMMFALDERFAAEATALQQGFAASSRVMKLVTYPSAMQGIRRIVERSFPAIKVQFSEREVPYFSGTRLNI